MNYTPKVFSSHFGYISIIFLWLIMLYLCFSCTVIMAKNFSTVFFPLSITIYFFCTHIIIYCKRGTVFVCFWHHRFIWPILNWWRWFEYENFILHESHSRVPQKEIWWSTNAPPCLFIHTGFHGSAVVHNEINYIWLRNPSTSHLNVPSHVQIAC